MDIALYDFFDENEDVLAIGFWLEQLPISDIKRVATKLGAPKCDSKFKYTEEIEDNFSKEEIVAAIKSEIFSWYRHNTKFKNPVTKTQVLRYLSFLNKSELKSIILMIKKSVTHIINGDNRKHHIVEIRTCKMPYQDLYKMYKKLDLLPGQKNKKSNPMQKQKHQVQKPKKELSATLLNTSVPLEAVTEDVSQFLDYLKTEKSPMFTNYNLFFHGPPGTGKTMFAQTLADAVGRPLITVTASDLLSHYVGETEEIIAGAFIQAQKKNAILFLDEMDAILGDRDGASASWERSQVNEFLVQMERFKGVFIASTNYPKILDKALDRRFAHKIGFNHLKPDQLETFFSFYFKLKLENLEKQRLLKMHSLAPGDFKVALQRCFFRKNQSVKLYLNELEAINDSKSKKQIGL